MLEAKAEKKKKKKRKENKNKNKNNNNYTRFDGLITDGIMKGVTISPGLSTTMISDFRNYKKSAAAYATAKDYKHWPGVIRNMEPIPETEWKTKRPDKSQYTKKRTTKVSTEGEPEILKQE